MSWDNQHDCDCHHKRDDDWSHKRDDEFCRKHDRHHDSSFDCGCKHRRRSVSIQCKCGNCFEVKRSHCGSCSHLFGHNW